MSDRPFRTRAAELTLVVLAVLLPAAAAVIHLWMLPLTMR